jgi:hypothetical protein
MTTTKKTLVAAALLAALGTSTQANALLFNPDGGGAAPTADITGFDWAPSNVLVKGGNAAVVAYTQDPTYNPVSGTVDDPTLYAFDVYVHAVLTGTLGESITGICAPGVTSCTGGNYEISMTMAFKEYVSNVQGSTAVFAFATGTPNFFEMYSDPAKDSNALNGTGFDNGTLILSSKVAGAQLGSFTNITNITGGTQDFDQTTDAIDDYPTIDAILGTGNQPELNISISVADLSFNPLYFPGNPTLASWDFLNISLNPFFKTVNPSDCFDGQAGSNTVNATCNSAGSITPVIGTVNGATLQPPGGADFQLQSDFNNPVTATYVPEPATLSLLGLGLFAIGAISRRRRLI